MKGNKKRFWLMMLAGGIGLSGCTNSGWESRWDLPESETETITSQSTEADYSAGISLVRETSVPAFDGKAKPGQELPRKYDARAKGRTSPVKDQGNIGTCWAFASLLAVESSLRPEEEWDFSEDHMSRSPGFYLDQEDGGEYTMSMAYLLSWRGPVREADDPYGDGMSPEGLKAVRHVQEIQILPARDLDLIKRAVWECGGVQTSLYTTLKDKNSSSDYYNQEKYAYCYRKDATPNHDVVIVGWDDDFPKESFYGDVPNDGAFLCQNSWGTGFGEGGYFYVSYLDANIGKSNVLYSLIEDTDNYDSIYQSDLCGWIGQLGYGNDTAWAVNVYQAAGAERLAAAGFYATKPNTEYELYVVRQLPKQPQDEDFSERILVARGAVACAGYYTIPLSGGVDLEPGERFGIMVRLVTPDAVHPIAIEYDASDGKCIVDLNDGEGYISQEGNKWQQAEREQKCNICLKAYTVER